MKISVVTAVYNNAATIVQAMQSVQSQRDVIVEHVIVDGQSNDGTDELVRSHLRSQDKYVSEPDEGIYDALNKGIRMASGDVVGVLGSDDYYASADVLCQVARAFATSGTDAVYGDLAYIRSNSRHSRRFWEAGEYRPGSFARAWVPPHPTFFCKRELFERYGFFRLDMPVAADFELMLRLIALHEISVRYLPETITVMRLGGISNRLAGIVRGNASILRAFRLNGFGFPWLYLVYKPLRKLRQYLGKRSVHDRVECR